MVRRDSVDRRVASTLTSQECLLVEPGDFAYNMMRMWQGAVDLCKVRGVVSPAYVVCRPHLDALSPPFMFYFFKSPIGLYQLWSYSYGITDDRLRLLPEQIDDLAVQWIQPDSPIQEKDDYVRLFDGQAALHLDLLFKP